MTDDKKLVVALSPEVLARSARASRAVDRQQFQRARDMLDLDRLVVKLDNLLAVVSSNPALSREKPEGWTDAHRDELYEIVYVALVGFQFNLSLAAAALNTDRKVFNKWIDSDEFEAFCGGVVAVDGLRRFAQHAALQKIVEILTLSTDSASILRDQSRLAQFMVREQRLAQENERRELRLSKMLPSKRKRRAPPPLPPTPAPKGLMQGVETDSEEDQDNG